MQPLVDLANLAALAPAFVLVVFRVAGLMLFAPLFGSGRVPRRIKGLLALTMAVGMAGGIDLRSVAVPDTAWARTAHHPEHGTVTLDGQLRTYAAHGEGHLDQIRRTLAARG